MSKQRKQTKQNGAGEEYLTAREACEYAATQGVVLTPNALAIRRSSGCEPVYVRVNGYWIRYTKRHIDALLEKMQTQLIYPENTRRHRQRKSI